MDDRQHVVKWHSEELRLSVVLDQLRDVDKQILSMNFSDKKAEKVLLRASALDCKKIMSSLFAFIYSSRHQQERKIDCEVL